jgi:hypothetical protein
MRLELERGFKLNFWKNWNKLSLILCLHFLCCSFTSDAQGTFVRDLQFAQPMTQRLFDLVEEWEKNWRKKFDDDDKYMFSDVRFYVSDKVERGLLDQVHEEWSEGKCLCLNLLTRVNWVATVATACVCLPWAFVSEAKKCLASMLGMMIHWYHSFWELGSRDHKSSWVQTKWCPCETTPARLLLPMSLTWGANGLSGERSGLYCCCTLKKTKEKKCKCLDLFT